MVTVILCGGLGSRLAEETELTLKPLVEIGGRPILWHILRLRPSGWRSSNGFGTRGRPSAAGAAL
jgi:dTDP-glucose pyrophosphorylase